jgi:predicted secreted protein
MKARGLLALMVFLLAASGCGTSEESFLPTDRDERFNVDVGDEFQVVLESNVTTGYGWQLEAALDGGVLELVGDRYEAPNTDLVGAAGLQVFDFHAVGDGSTFIQLWYIRPFDDPPDPADRAQFEVIVGSGDTQADGQMDIVNNEGAAGGLPSATGGLESVTRKAA